ncbi:MAG: hypothetical protein H0V17_28505 [Deltaproteobacteria bacterium]|nr:hypothetical protein [Deltaproteobacteria bacterium]
MRSILVLALVLVALPAIATCGGGFDPVRYRNQAPVTIVNDRVHLATQPREIAFVKMSEYFDAFFYQRIVRFTQQRPSVRSANVNSMDEVPDSTWFRNRIGVREVSLDEMRDGAKAGANPMLHKPWKIKSTKVGGVSIGFIIEDATGAKYVLKFDQKGLPETETAADVIGARLFWACGYHTPDNQIVTFTRADLVIGKDAQVKPLFGAAYPLTEQILEDKLARVKVSKDGSIRGLASRFLIGKPLGPWPREGVRSDDPNDTVPHELRRDLRGAYAVFSWLDHVDMKADQTVDMFVEDAADPKVNYVMHYNVDFGKMFGVFAEAGNKIYVGHSHLIDPPHIFGSLLSLGLWRRPWEGRNNPRIPGVGIFESKGYDPGVWKPVTPSYTPLLFKDRFDAFWGAKILIRFTEPQIRAAVGEGQFSDRRAVDYLTKVLVERQRKTARYWFDRVNPLDAFEVKGEELCFEDLTVRYDLNRALVTYTASGFDFDGRPIGPLTVRPGDRGRHHVCLIGLKPSTSQDGYSIVRIEATRAGTSVPPVLVHLAKGQGEMLRIIGLPPVRTN